MVANIAQTEGIAHFASAREHAWHRLGQVLPDAMTAEQALDAAHLSGWNVRKVPEYAHVPAEMDETGVREPVQLETGKFSTIRTNPINGQVEVLGGGLGAGYTVIQNEEHADLLNTLVDESGAVFETAGALGTGSTVFLSMKLPQHIEIVGHEGIDTTNLYIVAANSHDGSSAFRLMVTPVRVVCQNTLSYASSRAKSKFSIRHSSGAGKNLQVVREALGFTFSYVEDFTAQAQRLADREMSTSKATEVVRDVLGFPTDLSAISAQTDRTRTSQTDKVNSIIKLWTDADTNANLRGTAYGLYNAVVEYADHFMPVQGKGDAADLRAARTVSPVGVGAVKERTFTKLLATV